MAYIPEDIDAEMANTKVQMNDVLLNITGASIGRCTIYDLEKQANVNQHVCIIRAKPDMLPQFLKYYLQSQLGQQQIFMLMTKGNREGLNFQQLGNFDIPFPLLAKQQEITGIFQSVENSYHKTLERISLTKTIKKNLLSNLL